MKNKEVEETPLSVIINDQDHSFDYCMRIKVAHHSSLVIIVSKHVSSIFQEYDTLSSEYIFNGVQ